MYIENVQSDVAYFSEQEEAKSILAEISHISNSLLFRGNNTQGYSDEDAEPMISKLISNIDTLSEIITKYMNVEVLLYQYIESLIGDIFDIIKRFMLFPSSLKVEILTRNGSNKSTSLLVLEKLCYYLYIISKCVGIRRLINYAPNDVNLFEKVTETIEFIQKTNSEPSEVTFTKYEDHLWCVEFIILAWQSLLIYTPFELNTIWHHASNARITFQTRILTESMYYLNKSTKARDGAAMVISNLFSRKDALNSQDFHFFLNLCQDILTNPDYRGSGSDEESESNFIPIIDSSKNVNNHLSIGVLMVLKQILKRVASSDLSPYLDIIQYCLFHCEGIIVNSATKKLLASCLGRLAVHYLPAAEYSQKYRRKYINLFNTNTSKDTGSGDDQDTDFETRVEWESNFNTELVELFVSKILDMLTDSDIRVRWASAKSLGRISSRLPIDLNEEIIEHIIELINSQFSQMPNVANTNSDQGSGFGFKGTDSSLLNLVLRPLSVKSESVVHGGCLAIAEILRKGLIHPNMLDRVLDTTILSLSFEVWRGKGSAGTAVRDASCYICWAIARTFTKEMLSFDHVSMMSRALVNVSLFDSSVNCRRAACSALQELLGRIGTVPRGLELIQMCNFYTVSNRKRAFVEVCQQVSTLGYYSNSMLQNIITTKLFHPDLSTRELASLAIYKILSSTNHITLSRTNDHPKEEEVHKGLSTLDKEESSTQHLVNYLINYLLSNLMTGLTATTHGSLRALTRLISFVIDRSYPVDSFFSNVLSVPVTFEKKRMFRGKGSSLIRQSVCKLIASNCKLILHVYYSHFYKHANHFDANVINDYIVVLKDSLRNFALDVQLASVEGFEQVFLLVRGTPKFTELLTFFFNSLSSTGDHIAARRGYALGFSSIPVFPDKVSKNGRLGSGESSSPSQSGASLTEDASGKSHEHSVNAMLKLLCNEIRTNPSLEIVRDAKTRQFALVSIMSIITRLDGFVLDSEIVKELTETLILCCNDYEIDSRGDVGSWIRELSAEVIVYVLNEYLFKNRPNHSKSGSQSLFANLTKDMATDLTRGLVSLSLENLDHVRSRSTFLFCHLFTNKLSKFNFTWIWNRIFFNTAYEHLISSDSLNKRKFNFTHSVLEEGADNATPTSINTPVSDTVRPVDGTVDYVDNYYLVAGDEQKDAKVEDRDTKVEQNDSNDNVNYNSNGSNDDGNKYNDNEDDDDVDREIQMYIDENLESNMYINIDNRLLDGFNMLYDISKKLLQVISLHFEEATSSSDTTGDSASTTTSRSADSASSGNDDSDNSYDEKPEFSLIGSEKVNVALRIPGWSAAPLTFKTFLWVLLIPSYSSVAFRSIVNIIGQNTRLEVTIHSSRSVMVLEDVLVDFIGRNRFTLIVWNGEPLTLEQVINRCSVQIYQDAVSSGDSKTAMRLVNTLKILFGHRVLFIDDWDSFVSIIISEAGTASNYAYLKSIVRFLQVLLMDEGHHFGADVTETLLSMLSHQRPSTSSTHALFTLRAPTIPTL
ncbi:beta-tubulin cofactor D [Theileria orientalis]|uniref:Beta-tubulin cofactor D n=1 Tax=Theileria orientalis TaxID=68886 RepID=A0A976ME46_THEOR|nr:beta-tubulin cofactor D [Theileria orientalis]